MPSGIGRKTLLRSSRVPLESLNAGETDSVGGELGLFRRVLVIQAEPSPDAEVGEHRETTSVASRARGGEHVVRTGAIVAHNFGGARTDEQAAVRLARLGIFVGILGHHFQVLRANLVRHLKGLLHVRTQHAEALAHGHAGHWRSGQVLELPRELGVDALNHARLGGYQDRQGVSVVLGLGEEVRRNHRRVRRLVGEDEALAWASEHVDGAAARDELLRSGNPAVAGADDDVARGHLVLDAICKRADRVRTPQGEKPVRSGDVSRRQRRRLRPRRRHPDVVHAGHLGRERGH
mmetsp:Transcript_1509/g.4709  ORF Transcript_1509/g.4709 Transcript_1509/m.4709 type:complete len:292 (-) Transcript_1509:550-1425(-)